MALAVCDLSTLFAANGFAADVNVLTNEPGLLQYVEAEYAARKAEHRRSPTNELFASTFARVCFERAEFSTNATERALLAEQGINTCREILRRNSNSASARLYLAMNLGQLARTKTLGALTIVTEMERQFIIARQLDERLDFAGPDRYLGLLYREAPVIVSVGDRSKARRHLLRAVELAPEYPANRLNLAESFLSWGEKSEARRQLDLYAASLPVARTNFSGARWSAGWADWDERYGRVRGALTD
jgi:hypothetical protein